MPSQNTYCLTWVSLTLDVGYLFTAAPYLGWGVSSHGWGVSTPPDLERGVAPLGPPCLHSSCSLELGLLLSASAPDLQGGVVPLGCRPWPRACGSSSRLPPLTLDVGKLLLATTPALSQPGALGHYPWPWARGSSSWPRCCAICRSRRARRYQFCQHLNFRFLAFWTMRWHISVLKSPNFWCFVTADLTN